MHRAGGVRRDGPSSRRRAPSPPGHATPSAPPRSRAQAAAAVDRRPASGSAPRAAAATAPPKSIAPSGTQPYALDFTLPTLGKSGCMVCHGDRNLIRIKGDQYVSYYVSDAVIDVSAHGPGPKTARGRAVHRLPPRLRVDGAAQERRDWQQTAQAGVPRCHTLEDDAFGKGAHAVNNKPGQVDPKADAEAAVRRLPRCARHQAARRQAGQGGAAHGRAAQVCGRCHQKEWDSYADYYHGAAYTRGAPDAPACWDCHGAHEILPSSDRRSPTNADNLVETCGGERAGRKCHEGVNEEFVELQRTHPHARRSAGGEPGCTRFIQKVRDGNFGHAVEYSRCGAFVVRAERDREDPEGKG